MNNIEKPIVNQTENNKENNKDSDKDNDNDNNKDSNIINTKKNIIENTNNMESELKPYFHLAKYYETDQMAVIHHSNYIRWFEEARVDFLDQIGLPFDKIEAAGIYSPVLGISCEYKSSVRFNEMVMINTNLKAFNGIKMTIEYRVLNANTKQVRATGESNHCFISKDFKPVSLKKDFKEMYDILIRWVGIADNPNSSDYNHLI